MGEIHSLQEKVDHLLHELARLQSDARDHRQEVDLEAQPFTKARCKVVQESRHVEIQAASSRPPAAYDVKLDACSNRKRAPSYSFGHGLPSDHRGRKRSRAATAIEGPVGGEGQPGVRRSKRPDLCEACDVTCWWGCECTCHQGCDDLTDDESYWRSPKRAASPQKGQETATRGRHLERRDAPPRRVEEQIKGCSFGKAPRWGSEPTRNISVVDLSHECQEQHIGGHSGHGPQEDICMACDTTCWWGCECACHEGCDDLTDEGGYWESPRRRTAAAAGTAVSKGGPLSTARARSFTFSRTPRWGRTDEGEAAPAVNSVPATDEEPSEMAAPEIAAQPDTPILNSTSKQADTGAVKERAQDDMVLSTRHRAPAARFGRPSPCTSAGAARSRQRRVTHTPTPGPGQYDPSTSQRRTTSGPVFAPHDLATARPRVQHVLAVKALQHRALGPGTYDAAKVLTKLQNRDPSAVIMPQGKTTSRRPQDAPPETVAEAKTVSPKPYKPAASDAKGHRRTQRRGHQSHRRRRRKAQAKQFESKWASSSDGDDAKCASTSSTDSASWKYGQYSSSDDSPSSADETPSTQAMANKVASASRSEVRLIHDSWSQVKGGVIMRGDTPAGVTWRNRIALAKVREERERCVTPPLSHSPDLPLKAGSDPEFGLSRRPSRLYGYEVRHTLTDPRILGGAGFEAQERARVKEQERKVKNPRLRERQAMISREQEAQAEFVGPQLPHAWVQETRQNKRPSKADEAARTLVEVDSARFKVVEAIAAYGASLQKNLKPVLRYGEPEPVPPTLARARARREAEARARETWLGPQLHGELTRAPVVDIGKLPGRQVVVIEKKGQVQVTNFMEPPRATSDIGPGYYSQERPFLAGCGATDFSKMISRDEAFGPHGERPAEEDDERGMDRIGEQRGGGMLILEPDKAVVQKRVKSFSFARAGISAPDHAAEAKQGPAEGDVLDLDVCVEVGMERKGGKLVSFDRQHGRDEGFYRHKPIHSIEDDDGAEGPGDMLELEVKREATESRSKSAAFSKSSRWAAPRQDDGEGQVLPLSLQHHVGKRNVGGGVSFARQAGRWDKEVEEEALNKQAIRDEREGARFELEAQIEASRAVERAHHGGLLSTRASAPPVVDMSKQRERVGHGREGLREPSKDDKQMTEKALCLEAERAEAMERAERTALSNKAKGGGSVIDFSKARGRSPDRTEQERMDAVREGGAAEGEVLVLEPSAKLTSRVKRSRGALDWSKLKSRFAEPDQVDERPSSPQASSQPPTRPAAKGVSFALQIGRLVDASNRADHANEHPPEGQRLILDHTSTVTSDDRRVKGGSFMGPGETSAATSGVRRPSTKTKTVMIGAHTCSQVDTQQELPVVTVVEPPPWRPAGAGDEGVQTAELRSLSPPVLRPIGVIEQALRHHGLTDDRAGSSSRLVASDVVSQGSIGQSVGAAEGREAPPALVVDDLLDDLWNLEI